MSLIDEKNKRHYANAYFNMLFYALILLKNCSTNGGKLII